MEDANKVNGSEVHAILKQNQTELRQDFRHLSLELKTLVAEIKPCMVPKVACTERHSALDIYCDTKHATIDKTFRERMVDKNYFLGGLGVLGVVVLLVGVALKFWIL